MFVAEIVWT